MTQIATEEELKMLSTDKRIEEIKNRLERNKKWTTQTNEGWVPSVVGEYRHDDVEWLIQQAEKYQRIRDRMLEQTIQKNHEALKKLADS